MAPDPNVTGNFWGYLINTDKSASPLLEQLCLGIAGTIGRLEPGSDSELTPSRLAAFYRSVGGNYDSLFLKTKPSGLSYIYKTLGCFHSLQPTTNPFESPCIPSLLPRGYVRWQTLQLLLCTEEHVAFMQEAVKRYDIPNPEGGTFPKAIPRDAFPEKPDAEMEKWHKMVMGSLEQEHQWRLKGSPYPSPRDLPERSDEYFLNTRGAAAGRPLQPSRAISHERDQARPNCLDERRRSSVPDIPSPFLPGSDANHYWASDAAQTPMTSSVKHSHSKSNPRSPTISSRHRPSSASTSHRYSSSSHRTSNSTSTYRPSLSTPEGRVAPSPPQNYDNQNYRRPSVPLSQMPRHSRAIVDDLSSSGSEGSSENSVHGRKLSSAKHTRDGQRRTSLFPPKNKVTYHPRRHSHDATYLSDYGPPLPSRPTGYPYPIPESGAVKPEYAYKHVQGAVPQARNGNGNGVQFRNVFGSRGDDAAASAPESPIAPDGLSPKKGPHFRYFDSFGRDRNVPRQKNGVDTSEAGNKGGGFDQEIAGQQKFGLPVRISTVTGVGGRKYPAAEPRGAVINHKSAPMVGVAAAVDQNTGRVWA